nr:2B [Potamipivirus A]
QGSKNMFSAMGETIKGFFKEQIFDAIKCDITKTLFKLILRTVCYGICFCSSPGLLTGAAVGTLIAMDLANVEGLTSTTKDLLTALLNGDMGECAAAMSNIIYENSSDREMMVRTACEEFSRLVGENPDKVRGQGP